MNIMATPMNNLFIAPSILLLHNRELYQQSNNFLGEMHD